MADAAGYDDFVTARWPVLVRSAMLLGCTRADAEDVAQTALIRCFAAWRRVSTAGDPDAYVYRILVNALRKSRRRLWWGETPTGLGGDDAGLHGDHAPAVVMADAVRRALAALPPEQRAVLVLRYFSDLSEPQTAAALGIPVGTVKSRASRALAALASDEAIVDAYRPEREPS